MTLLPRLDRFLLSSTVGRIDLLVVCGTLYGVRRSELERAGARHAALISKIDSEISSSRRETNRLRQQNALRRQQLERLRSSLCGLEAQAAGADVAAATTARAYLALLEGEGLIVSSGGPPAGSEPEEPLA